MAIRESAVSRIASVAFAALVLQLAGGPALAQGQDPRANGWDGETRQFFLQSCIKGMAAGAVKDFELAKGGKAPPDTVTGIERRLVAPCTCMQNKAAAKWSFLDFANNQPQLQEQLRAMAQECAPK